MYRSVRVWWGSVDLFAPFGDKEYLVTPIINNDPTPRKLYRFESNLSLNGMIEWSAGVSLFGKINYQVKGTNNILLDEVKPKSFQTGTLDELSNIIISSPIQAYDTNYDYFINQSLKPELIFFVELGKFGSIGFSPQIEYNFGAAYKATNWKLGVPFSLKDKEGKPTVNFEVQWQEKSGITNTFHYVGVTTSLLFGNLL